MLVCTGEAVFVRLPTLSSEIKGEYRACSVSENKFGAILGTIVGRIMICSLLGRNFMN